MLKWSGYNLVFRSRRFGPMLYNALSNRLMTINAGFEEEIPKIQADPMGYDFSDCFPVFTELIKNKVLVGEHEEQDLLDRLKMNKFAARYDRSRLALTILPTESCNFACPYCYEKLNRPGDMDPDTVDKLAAFVEGFLPLKHMKVCWFGGEPLLRFDTIRELSRRFRNLDIPFESSLITNGWRLTPEVTARLDDVNIRHIQVTIDGPARIHNARRFHRLKGDSFQVIRENLDRLMLAEKWQGRLDINCVIDENNAAFFGETQDSWLSRYKDCNVRVGANFTDSTERCGRNMDTRFDRDREVAFYLDHFRHHRGRGLDYAPQQHHPGCCAAHMNAYVVGAGGQVYKCWEDIGIAAMEIGSVHTDPASWDRTLETRYVAGVEPFEDPVCRKCFYLPVCNPCPKMQYKKKYEGRDMAFCTRFKGRLPEFLEIRHAMSRDHGKK